MGQIYIEDLNQHAGKEVVIKGWVYNRRSSGSIQFLMLRDGTGIVQGVVVKAEVTTAVFALAKELLQESSVIARDTAGNRGLFYHILAREAIRDRPHYCQNMLDMKLRLGQYYSLG